MRKTFITIAIAILVLLGAQYAHAAATQNIVITVTITATVSLTVSDAAWDLTGSTFSTEYATGPIALTNDGSVYETFKIQGANSSTANWTMAGAVGANQFMVEALIGTTSTPDPGTGDFSLDGTDTLNNAGYVVSTATDIGDATWDAAYNPEVAPAGTRDLHLLFSTPTSGWTSNSKIGTITLVVSADAL